MTYYWTRSQTTHFITSKVFQPFFPKTNFSLFSQRAAQRKCDFSGMGWSEHLLPMSHTVVLPPRPHCPLRVPSGHWDACCNPCCPLGCDPAVNSMALLQGTASVGVSNISPTGFREGWESSGQPSGIRLKDQEWLCGVLCSLSCQKHE